jgi:outer membrane protein assembly factor BamB
MRGVRILMAAVLTAGSVAFGQPAARPFREAVSLAVDAEAARTVLTLEDRWAAGQWEAALDTLIELAETRSTSLVQTDSGDGGGLARYVRVQMACDRFIAALPPDGLADYRRRIEPRAKRLWEAWQKTGEVATLERLAEQMFYSRYGDQAVWELGRQAWDRGELSAARAHWRSLLPAENFEEANRERRFPDTTIPQADIAARLILCDLVDGRLSAARTAFAIFRERHPMAKGMLAGREGTWTDLLTDEVRAAEAWSRSPFDEDVPTFAGTASRAFHSPAAVDLGSELWSVALPLTRLPTVPRVSLFPTAAPPAYHPAVADCVVFLNDGQRIFAWRLDSGRPAYGDPLHSSGQIYPAFEVDPLLEPRRPVTGAPRWTVTVHGQRLYARMGSPVTTPAPMELRDQRTELVCLDLSEGEGRLLWSKPADELAQPTPENEDLPAWAWEGTPVAHEGRLYAVRSRRRPQLAWNVACLDAESGRLLWHRPVGISRPTPPDNENLATSLLLTLADGRLFLSTDWGAIAALDADAGHLLWAVSYESEPLRLGAGQPTPRWIGPPCLVADGRVFAAPLDTDQVFCLDAQTGYPHWRIQLPDRVRNLLGTANGRMMVSGDSLWGLDLDSGAVTWSVQPTEPEQAGFGRGWLAGDIAYWPSREALSVVDQRTGQVLREQPLLTPTARRFGGNVVVTGGVLLIAEPDRLTAYGQYALIESDLRQKVSRRSEDHRLRRRLAEVVAAQGDHREARELLATIPVRTVKPASFTVSVPQLPALPAVVEQASDFTSPLATSGFWSRAWTRPLGSLTQRVVPITKANAPVVLVQGVTLSAWDRRTGVERWSAPLDRPVTFAAVRDRQLIWGTDAELVFANIENGEIVDRMAWPAEYDLPIEGRSAVRMELTEDRLLIAHPRAGLWAIDVDRRRGLWRQAARPTIDVEHIGFGSGFIGWHPRGSGRTEFHDLATGAVRFLENLPSESWRRPPVWSRDGGQCALVMESGHVAGLSATGREQWRTAAPLPQVHAAPWVFECAGRWFAVVNGLTLIRLGDDGRLLWSAGLTLIPLTTPEQSLGLNGDRIVATAGGEVRCLDLNDGHVIWSRRQNDIGPQRVLVPGQAANHVWLLPATSNTDIECVSLKSGKTRQSVRLPAGSRLVTAWSDQYGVVFVTGDKVLALTQEPPARLAQER